MILITFPKAKEQRKESYCGMEHLQTQQHLQGVVARYIRIREEEKIRRPSDQWQRLVMAVCWQPPRLNIGKEELNGDG